MVGKEHVPIVRPALELVVEHVVGSSSLKKRLVRVDAWSHSIWVIPSGPCLPRITDHTLVLRDRRAIQSEDGVEVGAGRAGDLRRKGVEDVEGEDTDERWATVLRRDGKEGDEGGEEQGDERGDWVSESASWRAKRLGKNVRDEAMVEKRSSPSLMSGQKQEQGVVSE